MSEDVLATDKNDPRVQLVRAKALIGTHEKEKSREQLNAILSSA